MKKKVLWATGLLKPDENDTLRFKAPEKPDDYPYVCTFPGHWRTMNGTMHVVENQQN
jgi:azurin